jgi:hypothetical protein
VHVPEQVGANGVQPYRLAQLKSMAPVFLRHARRVNFAAADLESLPVEEKIVIPDREGMSGACASDSRDLVRE